jgi:hypothetical protein
MGFSRVGGINPLGTWDALEENMTFETVSKTSMSLANQPIVSNLQIFYYKSMIFWF